MSIDAIKVLGSLLSNGSAARGSGNNALGGLLGSVLSSQMGEQQGGAGGLGDLLGGLMNAQQGGGAGGIGGALGGLLASQMGGQQGGAGGLGGMLGGLLGGGQAPQAGAAGGLTDLLGSAMGGQSGGLGGLLGAALGQHAQQANPNMTNPNPGQYLPSGMDVATANNQAELLIKAMINAAKADGTVDAAEKEQIIAKLGADITQDEADFIRREFNAPLDAAAFARQIPAGMEQQVYLVSLTAIDLDQNREAQYLDQLAKAMNLSPQIVNQMHDQLGVQKIYA